MFVLGSLVCEWLLCFDTIQVYSWCLLLALQLVSDYCALLHFKPHDAYPWLFREWVIAVPCCVSDMLTNLVLALQYVSDCCALLYFKLADTTCPWHFSVWVGAITCCMFCQLMMSVIGSSECEWLLLLHFSLLTILFLGSAACGWLFSFAAFQACWQCLFLAL